MADHDGKPYRETLEPGCFREALRMRPERLRVHLEHTGQWVGRGEQLSEQPDGLHVVLRLDDTEAGRTAGYKIRDGQTPGFSIGFTPGKSCEVMHDDGPVVHREVIARLGHVALVPANAYSDAQMHRCERARGPWAERHAGALQALRALAAN